MNAEPSKRPSLAWYLLWAYLALVVYASFYPFLDWRAQGVLPWAFLNTPTPRLNWTAPDNWLNWLAYIPVGGLLALGWMRRYPHWSGWQRLGAAILATACASAWSFATECLQTYLPTRVPSLLDWTTNTAGAATGALLALASHHSGATRRWHQLRERFLRPDAHAEAALLALWPLALLTPTAVPYGVGHVSERLIQAIAGFGFDVQALFRVNSAVADVPELTALSPFGQLTCVALGVAGPLLMVHLAVVGTARRVAAVLVLLGCSWAAISLSSALSFGPRNAWAWWSITVQAGWVLGAALGLSAAWLPRRANAVFALLALVGMLFTLNQSAASVYFWQTLQTWEQGRFIHFYGVTQWLNWLWPFAAATLMLRRMLAKPTRSYNAAHE